MQSTIKAGHPSPVALTSKQKRQLRREQRMARLLAYITSAGSISSRQAGECLNLSPSTARKTLLDLVAAGAVEQSGTPSKITFVLSGDEHGEPCLPSNDFLFRQVTGHTFRSCLLA